MKRGGNSSPVAGRSSKNLLPSLQRGGSEGVGTRGTPGDQAPILRGKTHAGRKKRVPQAEKTGEGAAGGGISTTHPDSSAPPSEGKNASDRLAGARDGEGGISMSSVPPTTHAATPRAAGSIASTPRGAAGPAVPDPWGWWNELTKTEPEGQDLQG